MQNSYGGGKFKRRGRGEWVKNFAMQKKGFFSNSSPKWVFLSLSKLQICPVVSQINQISS